MSVLAWVIARMDFSENNVADTLLAATIRLKERYYFRCGFGFMATLRKMIVKSMLWLLAIFVPVQPVLAFDCSCNCRASAEATSDSVEQPASTKGCKCCSKKKSNTACKADAQEQQPRQRTWQSKLSKLIISFRPCLCGDDCDCQIRHEIRPSIVEGKVTCPQFDAMLPLVIATFTNSDMVVSAISMSRASDACGTLHSTTALNLCAHLCRFTI